MLTPPLSEFLLHFFDLFVIRIPHRILPVFDFFPAEDHFFLERAVSKELEYDLFSRFVTGDDLAEFSPCSVERHGLPVDIGDQIAGL